mmetsp:Transcript_14271/g.18020  ORF Transcript_14271/g.18020 Transcript_14271/m.18020 type:complete len:297 (-) Transcript_14271:80-970(-)
MKILLSLTTYVAAIAIVAHSFTLNNGSKMVPSPFTHTSGRRMSPLSMSDEEDDVPKENEGIDVSQDPRLYRIVLPRATGIEWGTDLSFSFVYVRDMEPGGPASMSNIVSKGDQICEFRAVDERDVPAPVIPLIGASFDNVMSSFASLKKSVKDVELVFFKGSKEELIALCEGSDSSSDGETNTITITAILNKGTKDESTKIITAEKGANLRQVLVDNGINVYQSFTRWTNCKGKQLCGTCIVNIAEGSMNTNRKSMDEGSTLRENPDSYRLSCVTFAYGDVTVETFPPIEAAQWTR